jgi:broad specificity phosphatase PhoE
MNARLLDLLRHGEVQGGPCFRGQRDDPLTDQGWHHMQLALVSLADAQGARWDQVICSPATRCRAFAEHFATARDLPLAVHEALAERDFGAWEGRGASEIPLEDLSAFWADPQAFDPPESEPFVAFRRRVAAGWRQLIASEWRHGLVLTHGGVIRTILGELLGLSDAALILLEVPPACITRIRLPQGGGRPSLVAHLPLGQCNETAARTGKSATPPSRVRRL